MENNIEARHSNAQLH